MLAQTPAFHRPSSPSELLAAAENPARAAAKPAPPRVLVVDDEALVRWAISQTLDPNLYEVEEAADAKAAVTALADGPTPNVVLLDLRLPDCNDLRLLETVRRTAPSAIVILMTAFGSPDVRTEALRLGAACVLDKPFELDQLVGLLSRLTTRH
jgi:two-component system nitrogen regulation response regulator GlnG